MAAYDIDIIFEDGERECIRTSSYSIFDTYIKVPIDANHYRIFPFANIKVLDIEQK